ncbi:energy transducer TonB [Beggiatoa leptomitoformis]|uniref:TonB family protein n=1 Tax=Beggiatoa leptomitoformis TaxID=288004 RepID=A0A2N9YD89_9GAMM|nr:energy transducer TonB [Beggiatoa leptomitoformis]ALG69132.1 TonB family protein [Beggiatoa leptomitoformis]AUI68452.1 TonB family protein [Beggiatoa leptomitoformis]
MSSLPPIVIEPSTERLIVMSFVATLFHLCMLYAVSFTAPKNNSDMKNHIMDVVLVQKSTEKAPDNAKFLAQANQQSGGVVEKAQERPSTPVVAPFPDEVANLVVTPPEPQIAASATPDPQVEQLTVNAPSSFQVASAQRLNPAQEPSTLNGDALETTVLSPDVPNTTMIMNVRASLASLQAELDKKIENYAKNPRKTFIGASTREYKYASYMDSWRLRVERIGTLHYPLEARQLGISGSLILEVAINKDGSINEVHIRKSSGNALIDDSALRIVHLSAPFAPLSEEIRKDTDILYITRTWEFLNNGLNTH